MSKPRLATSGSIVRIPTENSEFLRRSTEREPKSTKNFAHSELTTPIEATSRKQLTVQTEISPKSSRLASPAVSLPRTSTDYKSYRTKGFKKHSLDLAGTTSRGEPLYHFNFQTPRNTSPTGPDFSLKTPNSWFKSSSKPEPFNTAYSKSFNERLALAAKKREELSKLGFNDESLESSLAKLGAMFQESLKRSSREKRLTQAPTAEIMVDIELMTYRLFKQLSEQLSKLQEAHDKACLKNSEVESQNSLLRKKLLGLQIFDDEFESKKKQLDTQIKTINASESLLSIERTRVEQQRAMMSGQIDSLKANQQSILNKLSDSQNQKLTSDSKVKKLERIIDNLHTKLARSDIFIASLTEKVQMLSSESTDTGAQLDERLNEVAVLTEKLKQAQDDVVMYRSRAYMHREDHDILLRRFYSYQESISELQERLTNQSNKNGTEHEKKELKLNPQDELQKDFLIIRHVTDMYLKPSTKVQNDMLISAAYKRQSQDLNIKDYSVRKAPFDVLFEDLESNVKRDKKPVFDLESLTTVRAILDCKYNEFLLNPDDWRTFSKFPDFVNAWLGKFYVDSVTKHVRTLRLEDPDVASLRRSFRDSLTNNKCFKLWDAITFKEFLAETLPQDEVLFYLHIRFLLYNGPQLRAPGAAFEYMHLINYVRAEEMIEHVLKDLFDEENVRNVIAKVKQRGRIKNNQLFIDAGFCLRVILESYRKVKEKKFDALKQLIEAQPNISSHKEQFSISYRSFITVVETICPNYLELEMTELYRLSWKIGKGKVDAIAVITALNESGFLVKCLKLRAWVHLPVISSQLEFYDEIPAGAACKYIYEQYQNMRSTVDAANYVAGGLGVESIINQLYDMERFIENKFQLNEGILNGKNLVSLALCFYSAAIRVNHLEIFLRSNRDRGNDIKYLQNQFSLMQNTLKDMIWFRNEDVIRDIERVNWTKKLQRFFKRRSSSWYKLMQYILETKLSKKLQEDKENAAKQKLKVVVD